MMMSAALASIPYGLPGPTPGQMLPVAKGDAAAGRLAEMSVKCKAGLECMPVVI